MFTTLTTVMMLAACQVNEMETLLTATAQVELLRLKYQNVTMPEPVPTMRSSGTLFSAPEPPKSKPACACSDCKCTPGNCQCSSPSCPAFEKKASPPPVIATTTTPTNQMPLAEFREYVAGGGTGLLIVGNAVMPAVITGRYCVIASHKDCKDGVYQCYRGPNGPMQQLVTVTAQTIPATTSGTVQGTWQCTGNGCKFVPNR